MPDSSTIAFPPGITLLPVQKIATNDLIETTDTVAVEQPLEIRIGYGPAGRRQEQTLAITMRTPGNDEELALGWLFTEGILPHKNIPETIPETVTNTNTITIHLPPHITPDLTRSQRHSFTSSSCGVCGKTSLDNLDIQIPRHHDTGLSVPANLLYNLPDLLRNGQDIFDATGGLHAAGLFSAKGELFALKEDIGRHNALDKLIGYAGQRQLPLTETLLLLSGRACFELIQKAAMAGIPIIAAVGPPSSLAVRHAEANNITLVGFLRQQRFNIYSGAHRIHI
jgi:FdhD protein